MLNCPASLHAQGFSIEQALSAPYNSELIAAPKGGWLVWQANQQGHRNLWIAKPAGSGFAARSLTHYDADDGVELGDVTWTPDGGQVVYVRGGDFEAPEKPAPNPAMLLTPVEQDIWIVPAAGGEPRQVAEGRSPSISPDGRTLAYLFKDQVWTISLPAAKPAQLFHGRGKVSGLRWSGDGKYLAFVSHRDDHSFVGVYNFPTHTPSYLDPATTFDSEPAWAPDSRSLAFLRVPPGLTGYEFRPNRIAQPWSILVADPATGKTRTIWQARPGQGSAFREIVARDQLLWSADGRIVFPWEADGWLHLYSVAAAGGKAQLLTPGAFEVEQVALSPDHRAVVYSSNQDDIDRRHIWSVAPEGGAPKQLTGGTGIEVSPAISGEGKTVAILRSNARMPMRPAIVYPGGEIRDLAPQLIPHDFPGEQLTDPQQVVFSAADGLQLHAQLFLPHASAEGIKHPAVVFFHGGSRRQMLLGWHYMEYYSNAYAMNQYLASLGYIVLSVNYRSGIGYGLDFREAIDYGAAGASEFNDVLGAGLYLRARPDVDGTRIGAWGGSYGGYLTALALARASDLFAAGVDMHGVHDWNIELGNWQAYDANADPAAARIAFESSPLASVKTWRSPVLLIQGDDDRNVQFSQMVRMAAALRAQGVPFEEHVFPDEIHDFLLHQSWLTAYKLEATFLDKYLKPANK
jgi:dipeptidyl aminopeptidase/acylaminoacyl peptidase